MLRIILNALLKPGRMLGLDNPKTRLARSEEDRHPPITLPAAIGPTYLRVFLILGTAVAAMVAWHTLQTWEEGKPVTDNQGKDFAFAFMAEFAKTIPATGFFALPLSYPASAIGGMIMGWFQAGYNLMDRLLGQKAMVEKATAEGRAQAQPEIYEQGKADGIAQERERWLRQQRREPDA